MKRTSLLAAVLAAAFLAPSVARAQQSPTLGELALKEQQRRKALKATGKVLTNDDLPKPVAPAAPAAGGSQAPGTPKADQADPAAKPEAAAKPEDARDEAWWRQRMSQVREELRRNEMFAEALQTRINALTGDFATRDDPYQRARIAEDRAKAVLEMDRVKADVELSRKTIAELEEDARKAGVPPGWLR